MTDVCVTAEVPVQSSLKPVPGGDRSLAIAYQTDANRCSESGVAAGQDIRKPVEEARGAAIGTPARVKRATGNSVDVLRALENRHRWLLFAQHCYTCSHSEQGCQLGKLCTYGKKTLKHVAQCKRDDCVYPRCGLLKPLLQHSRKCQSSTCAICVPVWNYIQRDPQQQQQPQQQQPQQQPQQQLETQTELRGGSPKSPPSQQQQQQQQTGAAARAQGDAPHALWKPAPVVSLGSAAASTAVRRNAAQRLGEADIGDGRLPTGNPPPPQHQAQPPQSPQHQQRRASDSLRPPDHAQPPLGLPPPPPPQQRLQKQQDQGQQQQDQGQLSQQQQQQLLSVLGPPPPSLGSSGAHQFLGLAPGTFPPYNLPPYGSGLVAAASAPPPLGSSPTEASERPRSSVTVAATPPQPIPVLGRPGMLSLQSGAATAAPPQLMHTYPPSASSLGHFFSHLPQLQPPQPPGPAATASLTATHWLPMPGMAALPGAAAVARGAPATPPNGTSGADGGRGGKPGALLANGAAAAAAAINPPAAAAAGTWHSQGPFRAGPMALYDVGSDAVRPNGLGAMVQTGPMQSVERYGHPYALAGMNAAGGLPAVGGAVAMATTPLLIWPGSHQPAVGAMAAATAGTAAAKPAAAVAGTPQSHVAAHLAQPYSVGGLSGARLSCGASVQGSGGGQGGADAPIPELGAAPTAAIAPAAQHLGPHTLLYGPAALAPGVTAVAHAPGGGAVTGVTEAAAGPALWSYLLR